MEDLWVDGSMGLPDIPTTDADATDVWPACARGVANPSASIAGVRARRLGRPKAAGFHRQILGV